MTTFAPNALIVTPTSVQGGVATTAEDDPLNAVTPAQFRFLVLRGVSEDKPLVVGRFTGPAYPFGPSWAGTLGPKTDVEVIFTSIANIITTPIGTVPYRPFEGSEVPNLVFEPNDAVTRGLIRYFVERDLRRQEPRAKVLAVRTVVPDNDPHTVVITIAFSIVGDPEGRVFSAPVEFNTMKLAA